MKAHTIISTGNRRKVKALIAKYALDEIKSKKKEAAMTMMLHVIYTLRFNFAMKKRLTRFLSALAENGVKITEWQEDNVSNAKMVAEIERSGVSLGGLFDSIITAEEERDHADTEKRIAIATSKRPTEKQIRLMEQQKAELEGLRALCKTK